jgi:hypothetical protein
MTWVTLRRDLPTKIGTLAAGTRVIAYAIIELPTGGIAKICIDPPGRHLGRCHTLQIPTHILEPPS